MQSTSAPISCSSFAHLHASVYALGREPRVIATLTARTCKQLVFRPRCTFRHHTLSAHDYIPKHCPARDLLRQLCVERSQHPDGVPGKLWNCAIFSTFAYSIWPPVAIGVPGYLPSDRLSTWFWATRRGHACWWAMHDYFLGTTGVRGRDVHPTTSRWRAHCPDGWQKRPAKHRGNTDHGRLRGWEATAG